MTHDLVTTDAVSNASSDIESITKDAKEALGNMRRHAEQYVQNAQRLGAAIKSARENLPYGKFGAWCESELGLKPSQCSVYRQLYETGADLEKAREWAHQAGRSYASTRDVKLLLRCVDEWRAETGQEQPTKRRAKSATEVFAVKSNREVHEQLEATGVSDSSPPHILAAAANLASAIVAHRSATGEDVLDSTIDYITTAVRSGPVQSSAIAELSGPAKLERHGEEPGDKSAIDGTHDAPSPGPMRLRKIQARQN